MKEPVKKANEGPAVDYAGGRNSSEARGNPGRPAARVDAEGVQEVLKGIPADLPYQDWIRVAAALKNEGLPFEVFDEWSKTCPEKYDA